jgi:predicted neutral ceramidase superfamily lipid hydrolase
MQPDEIQETEQLKRIADASEDLVKIGWVIAVLFIALLVILLSLIFL